MCNNTYSIGPHRAKLTAYSFWTGLVCVCIRHTRGLRLQPIEDRDYRNIKYIFGEVQCPFCKGGKLYGTYHKYRSMKRLGEALDKLDYYMYVTARRKGLLSDLEKAGLFKAEWKDYLKGGDDRD
jgi:hypothetical protein